MRFKSRFVVPLLLAILTYGQAHALLLNCCLVLNKNTDEVTAQTETLPSCHRQGHAVLKQVAGEAETSSNNENNDKLIAKEDFPAQGSSQLNNLCPCPQHLPVAMVASAGLHFEVQLAKAQYHPALYDNLLLPLEAIEPSHYTLQHFKRYSTQEKPPLLRRQAIAQVWLI